MNEISLIKLLLDNSQGPFGWLIVSLVFLIIVHKLFLKPAGLFLQSYLTSYAESEKERIKNDVKVQMTLHEFGKSLDHILHHFEEQKEIMNELLIYLRKHNGKE